ncbi:MAG: Mrp/NBP35 family ATP-binding protein [Deltaproteobacteria bacterium]|nr:Mrp/NBP35 family ATP-binding protein [Deltaproteobacteria bacterium]
MRKALSTVIDPCSGLDLLTAAVVKNIEVAGGKASLLIELPIPVGPSAKKLEAEVVAVAKKVAGVDAASVTFSVVIPSRASATAGGSMPQVKNVVAISSGKGGVGKSTVTTNLAAALHAQGARVGILDADIYGPSVPQMMGDPDVFASGNQASKITPAVHHGMKIISIGFFLERDRPVIWRGPMIHKLLQQFIEDVDWGELDYLFIDLPPGTGDAQLSLSQLVPLTGTVLVTTPQEVAVLDVEKAFSMWKKVEVPVLGVIENMSTFECPTCHHVEEIFSKGGGRDLAEREGVTFFGAVPIQSSVRMAGDGGKPIVLAHPESKAADIFHEMASNLACTLAARNRPSPGGGIRSGKLTLIR